MQRIRLLLEYDGQALGGWQKQEGRPTVAGHIESCLVRLTKQDPASLVMAVAGRTDTGVHAIAQVCTFSTDDMREPKRFAPALNHFLPPTIRVVRADQCPKNFCPRHSARRKTYQYIIFEGLHASPLWHGRCWHVRKKLDAEAMQQAATALLGEHDFNSFRSVHCDAAHAVRKLESLTVTATPHGSMGRILCITLVANAFCRHMCRIFVGTLSDVGTGRRRADEMDAILKARVRTAAGQTAPGCGLTLMHIDYPADAAIAARQVIKPCCQWAAP